MSLADQPITQQDLADVLGLTDRHLRNLKRTIPPDGKRGTALIYRLGQAVQAYIAHVTNSTQERYSKKDLEEARIRQEIAKATKEEALARSAVVAAKRDEDAVVEIEVVQAELEAIFSNTKANMRGVPSGLMDWLTALVGEEIALQIVRRMEADLDQALEELARKGLDDEDPGEPPDEA